MPCSDKNIPLCAAVVEQPDCVKGVNYALNGVPCSISGDPHYVCLEMWMESKHDSKPKSVRS